MGWRRLGRIVATTVKAIIACRCQRAAPTVTTVLEILALTAPLIKAPQEDAAVSTDAGSDAVTQHASSSTRQHASQHHAADAVLQSPLTLTHALFALSLRLARGWAPAVVVAQGVRLVGSLVQKREHPHEPARQEGTEVRALQLGLTAVPRVDPRVPRTLEQYTVIYKEWLLLLRGRLAQSGIELPEGLFDACQEGDEELMRFALCYNLLQARSLKDALVAMDRTISNIKDFAAWYKKYSFIEPADLEAWQRIAWWEGPDSDGYLWLMIDFRAAVEASRTHGPELVARVLVSNMEYGVRQLIPELGCAATLRVVADASGTHVGAALRSRGVLRRVGLIIDRMYPCRLHLLYMVGLPFPLRWGLRAYSQLLHQHTRRKIRICRATDVPRRLPSQLRSHKLSLAAGLDALVDTQSYYGGVGGGGDAAHMAHIEGGANYFGSAGGDGGLVAGGGLGDGATSVVAAGSVVGTDLDEYDVPFTPRTPLGGAGGVKGRGLRRFRWRRGAGRAARGRDAAGGSGGSVSTAAGSRQWLRVRLLKQGLLLLLLLGVVVGLGYAVIVLLLQPGSVALPSTAGVEDFASSIRRLVGSLLLLQKQTEL